MLAVEWDGVGGGVGGIGGEWDRVLSEERVGAVRGVGWVG